MKMKYLWPMCMPLNACGCTTPILRSHHPEDEANTPPKRTAVGESQEVRTWAAAQPAERWVKFKRREGINGPLRGEFLHERMWLWDGREESARLFHLIVWRPAESPNDIKYVLSNASADTCALDVARMA